MPNFSMLFLFFCFCVHFFAVCFVSSCCCCVCTRMMLKVGLVETINEEIIQKKMNKINKHSLKECQQSPILTSSLYKHNNDLETKHITKKCTQRKKYTYFKNVVFCCFFFRFSLTQPNPLTLPYVKPYDQHEK